mmetsp:Transcript_11705/g.40458  ORF Transcript_11705/g.40458 Transcript_11705/m.40458 type:complete len:108 (+) Transcript_11705:112-435(+)
MGTCADSMSSFRVEIAFIHASFLPLLKQECPFAYPLSEGFQPVVQTNKRWESTRNTERRMKYELQVSDEAITYHFLYCADTPNRFPSKEVRLNHLWNRLQAPRCLPR